MAGNHNNAYATVTPSKVNLSEDITNAEDQGFRYRAEQRLVEKEQEAKKKEKQDRLDFAIANAPKFIPTGVKTIDEVNYLGLQKASDDYYKAFTEHEQLRVKDRTPEEDKKYLQLGIKKANLFNWSENQKRLTEGMANQMKDALEGIKNGTYIPDDEILKKASDALTGYVPGTDEMGLPTIGFIDLNGDGINDVTTLADVDNMLVVKPTKMMDPYKLAQTFAKDFKLDETSTQKGYTTYDNKFVPESELKATIENLITPEALQTEAYKRGLGKNYQWSEEEVNQLKNDLMNHTNSFIGTTSKEKKDLEAEDRDARLAFDKKKQAEELAFKKEKEANDQKIAAKKLKIAAKATNKNGSGKVIPTLDEAIVSGVEVVDTSNEDTRFGNKVQKNARLMTVTGVDIYKGKDIHKRLKTTFVNPDGTIVMQVEKFSGDSSTIEEITREEDIMEIMGAVVKDYDDDGNAVTYKSYNEIQKDLAKKAGIKINQKPPKGVGSKYNN